MMFGWGVISFFYICWCCLLSSNNQHLCYWVLPVDVAETVTRANIAPGKSLKVHYLSPGKPRYLLFSPSSQWIVDQLTVNLQVVVVGTIARFCHLTYKDQRLQILWNPLAMPKRFDQIIIIVNRHFKMLN